MKYEWKKQEKSIYLPGRKPELVEVPSYNFFAIHGVGNPNEEDFSERVGALYQLTFTIRMMPKSGVTPEGYYDSALYPLEGVWDFDGEWIAGVPLDKDRLAYTLMIRQPSFVTPELFAFARQAAEKKKPSPLLADVQWVTEAEGLCVQMTHIGPYDDEPASFAQMDAFLAENNLIRTTHTHRELYMGDPRKGAPENRRTVLRYQVRRA